MTVTLLFDLDDTLLGNAMEEFAPRYMQMLADYLVSRQVIKDDEQEKFLRILFRSTQKMLQNRAPDKTLKEVFDADFFPALGENREDLIKVFEDFYTDVFPRLRNITMKKAEALTVIEEARKRHYRLAIATNPLFPAMATLQRVTWAGFDPQNHPFEVITTYEVFHFCKPNPAYYAELLAYLGWPDGPVVMIGNDLSDDILAARRLGLTTFWVSDHDSQGESCVNVRGRLLDLLPWLEKTPEEFILPCYKTPEAILAILSATPAALQTFGREISATFISQRPQPQEWAINEVFCHLRDVDCEVNLPRFEKILGSENPFLAAAVTDPWAEERDYLSQDGLEALRTFIKTRIKVIDLLAALSPDEWSRPARHAILGPTNVFELARIIATHDQIHIQQIYQTMKLLSCFPVIGGRWGLSYGQPKNS